MGTTVNIKRVAYYWQSEIYHWINQLNALDFKRSNDSVVKSSIFRTAAANTE